MIVVAHTQLGQSTLSVGKATGRSRRRLFSNQVPPHLARHTLSFSATPCRITIFRRPGTTLKLAAELRDQHMAHCIAPALGRCCMYRIISQSMTIAYRGQFLAFVGTNQNVQIYVNSRFSEGASHI